MYWNHISASLASTFPETYLACPSLRVLLLHLDLDDITWVLDDLGDVCLVPPTDLSSNSFQQVNKATIHPVLPKHASAGTERRGVRFDHAERAMDRPEDKKDDKEMMSVPKAFKIRVLESL